MTKTTRCQAITFPVVDSAITLIVALHQCKFLEPAMDIDDRGTMYKMVHKLLHYLQPMSAVYHMRAVSLIWSLQEVTTKPHVESIVAQTQSSVMFQRHMNPLAFFGD